MRTPAQKNLLTGACIRAILTVLRQLIHFIHIHQEVVPTININYRDPRPIYEQVRDGLRTLIVSGALAGGEKLPSVRELNYLGVTREALIARIGKGENDEC